MVMYSAWNPPPGTAVTSGGTTRISTSSGVISVPTSQYQPSTTARPAQITPIQTQSYQPKPTTLPTFRSLLAPVSEFGGQVGTRISDFGAQFGIKQPEIAQFTTQKVSDFRRFVDTGDVKAQESGLEKGAGITPSYISKRSYDISSYLGGTIRAGVPELESRLGTPGGVLGYPVRSVAGLIEFSGMLPGGVETIVKKPEVIPSALAVGAYTSSVGFGKQFVHDPFQTSSDLIVGMAAFGGVGKIPISRLRPSVKPSIRPTELPTLLPGKAIKLKAGTKLATEFGRVESAIKQPLDFTQIKSLPKTSGSKVESWIKTHPEQNPVIGGSAAAKTQFRGARQPGDLDLFVKNPTKSGNELYKIVSSELGKDNVRISHKPSFNSVLIEVKIGGKWHHAVDIHSSVPKGMQFDLGFKTQGPVRIGGIKYQRAGELIQRKAASSLQPIAEGKLGPKPQRMKDVSDFQKMSQDIIRQRYEKAESSLLFKGVKIKRTESFEQALRDYQFHSSFGPDIYTTKAVLRGYERLPSSVKFGFGLASIGSQYPKFDVKPEYPSYKPPTKKLSHLYYPSYIPKKQEAYKPSYTVPSKTTDQYYPSYKPPQEKDKPYSPPYDPGTKEDPYYPPYSPPYEPTYIPPAAASYKPPIIPTTKKKPPLEKDKKKKELKRKGKKPDLTGWLLENRVATIQQMVQGRNPLRMPEKVKSGKSKA